MRYLTPFAFGYVFLASAAYAAAPALPEYARTPGAIDPAVTQDNIQTTICVHGYTKTVRPKTDVTNTIKEGQIDDWGYEDTAMKDYEEDHLISLELGGSPDDKRNLWPEPYAGKWGARIKDTVELELHHRVCSAPDDPDHITLKEAQEAIAVNWEKAYADYVCTRKRKLTAIMAFHCQ